MARQTYLLYVEPARLFFYAGATGAVLQVPIPWEIMHDMEITDKEKLAVLLQTFLKNNSIVPGSVVIGLSPQVTFEGTISPQLTAEQQKEQLARFLDTVPFQNVASQLGKLDNANKVIAANKEMIDTLRHIFEKLKFSVSHAIPVSALQVMAPELQTNLDMGTILSKADLAHQYNLISQSPAPAQQSPNAPKTPPPPIMKNKQTLTLIAVFGVLMIVLVIMVFTVLIPQSQPVKKPPLSALPAVPTPTPISIASQSAQLKPVVTSTVVPH